MRARAVMPRQSLSSEIQTNQNVTGVTTVGFLFSFERGARYPTAHRIPLASFEPGVISSATYGISLEPVGGSPTGRPTSPAIHARLVQATP